MLKLEQALISSFIDADFDLPIAHENDNYTPVLGTPYAQLSVLQNDITAYSVSDTDETDGVFRVTLRYPSGVGGIVPKIKAQEIIEYYGIGKVLEYEEQELIINGVSRLEGVPETGWYKIIISIRYRAFLRRG